MKTAEINFTFSAMEIHLQAHVTLFIFSFDLILAFDRECGTGVYIYPLFISIMYVFLCA